MSLEEKPTDATCDHSEGLMVVVAVVAAAVMVTSEMVPGIRIRRVVECEQ